MRTKKIKLSSNGWSFSQSLFIRAHLWLRPPPLVAWSNWVKPILGFDARRRRRLWRAKGVSPHRVFMRKYLNMNGLQNKQPSVQSNLVKVGQTHCCPVINR